MTLKNSQRYLLFVAIIGVLLIATMRVIYPQVPVKEYATFIAIISLLFSLLIMKIIKMLKRGGANKNRNKQDNI